MSQFIDFLMDDFTDVLQDMHWAIEDADWEKLEQCVSDLKSSAESIGATLLVQACEMLATKAKTQEYSEVSEILIQLVDRFKRIRTFLRLYQSCSGVITTDLKPELRRYVERSYRVKKAQAIIQYSYKTSMLLEHSLV